MGRRPEQMFLQGGHIDGQQAHEKMFIANYQRNANQNYEISPQMVRMAIIKILIDNKCWREGGEKGTLPHYWWESNLIQPQWRKASGKSLQSCLFCNPMDCIPPCPCVHGIFHPILQGIFPTQGWSPCLLCPLHWQKGSLPPGPPGNPGCSLHK